MSLLPIFSQVLSALCCSFIQMGEGGREGHSPSLSFPLAKMHVPHSALAARQPFRRGGGRRASDGGERVGGFPVPFRYNVGGGVICIPGRLGHSLPSSPFPAAPLPCSRNSAAEGERAEKGSPSPPSGRRAHHLSSPLSFLHFLCWSSLPCSNEPSGEEGRRGKIEGPSPLTSNSWGTTTLLTQRQVPHVEYFLRKKAL